tara:strand:+ start:6440 stop:6688 length:249 start_codon:yes stop_codon:yes gene_type:complete
MAKKKQPSRTRPVWHLDVVSSNIDKASYNFEKEKLLIKFRNGTKYAYEDVSLDEFIEFSKADSQGQWFMENIRPVKEFEKLK